MNADSNSNVSKFLVIKYNIDEKFLYYFYVNGSTSVSPYFGLTFDHANNIFIVFQFDQSGIVNLYHSGNSLYKTIIPQYNGPANDPPYHFAQIVAKLNPEGKFLWVNTIYMANLSSLSGFNGVYYPDIVIGDSGEVYSFYALTSLNPIDSIYILDSNNQKTIILQISNFNYSPIYRGLGQPENCDRLWDTCTSRQAEKTQSWQTIYFLTVKKDHSTDLEKARRLFLSN
jgi:hypothetical protein